MMYSEPYAGIDPRRRQEMEDSGMISEDRSAVANLPQDVKYHSWPEPRLYAKYNLDDTIRGINHQMDDDGDEMKKDKFPEKY